MPSKRKTKPFGPQGTIRFKTRASPTSAGPPTLEVIQTSLSPKELASLLRGFTGTDTRFVAQIVWGSPVSLTLSPTQAGND